MKTYYKIVSKDLKSIVSINLDTPDEYVVQYCVNRFVEPKLKGTSLFVFDTLKNVKRFFSPPWVHGERYIIYEAEVKNPKQIGLFSSYCNWVYLAELLELKRSKKKWSHKTSVPPTGTVFCSSVKLLKKVDI